MAGTTNPVRANQPAFDHAVAEITAITRRLVRADLIALGAPRNREVEAAKARSRGQKRDAATRKRLLGPEGSG